jgi:hypothetical protein
LSVLAFLALAGPAISQRKVEMDKVFKDKNWGYQIQPIKGWNSMPPDQEERAAVARWTNSRSAATTTRWCRAGTAS